MSLTLLVADVIFIITGIDEILAKHIAHLFIRDPISLFAEKLEQDVENESDHFEVVTLV